MNIVSALTSRFQQRLAPRLLAILLLLGTTPATWAVPASPQEVEIVQPDGAPVRLTLRGDEFFSWHETTEGFAVVKDLADGFWKYARPAADRVEFRAIVGARVGSTDPERLGLLRKARPAATLLQKFIEERRQAIRGGALEMPTPPTPSPSAPAPETPPDPPANPIPVSGTKTIKNIVILAAFADHWDSAAGTVFPAKGRVATSEYSNLFNQVNHTVDGAVGSVRDYYKEVSYGKLTVTSVVTQWVVLPQNEAVYGAGNPDANPRQMVVDAITAADAAGFDFSQGDSDGDGWVDCLTIIHSGHGQELVGNPSTSVWSHQGGLIGPVVKDGVSMLRYHTEPALRGSAASSTSIIRIGVICHEMGHFFGLPDLYDYSGTTDGLGRWSLMAGGSWNGSSGTSPAHFDAWSKCFLGFVTPVPVHSQTGLSLPHVEDNPVVGLLRDGTSNGEYYLIENRAQTGFDNVSVIYPGMVIYHVDSKSANNDLGTKPHPAMKIEEADGNNSLGGKTSSSEAGDVWTSTSGLAGGFRDQTGNQSTNAMLYQSAAYYNRSDLAAFYSYNSLSGFSAAGTTMTCNATTLRTAVVGQTALDRDYIISWPACSQTTKYEIQEGARATLTSFFDGAEEEESTHENWNLAGGVQRSSDGAKTGTYSYALLRASASVQSMTMRSSFKVTASTVISFRVMSHLASGAGYLKSQISNDGGNTWLTLGTESDYINTWPARSYNLAAISALGISAGDACVLRFVANFEYGFGYGGFPYLGFAVDDIAITGTEMAGYGGWATVNNNVTGTTLAITGKASNIYAYQVRAYADGLWQAYGPVGEITVIGSAYSDWTVASGLTGAAVPMTANPAGDGVTNLVKFASNLTPTIPDARSLTPGTGTAGLPSITTTTVSGGTRLVVEYLRRKNTPQLAYHVEFGGDLVGWSETGEPETVTSINTNWERVVVRDSLSDVRRFGRVRVVWTN